MRFNPLFKIIAVAATALSIGTSALAADGDDFRDLLRQLKNKVLGPSKSIINCQPSRSPLFLSDDTLSINMKGNFPNQSDTPQPALMALNFDGQNQLISFSMTDRGHSRKSYCPFKPLLVAFAKDQDLSETPFAFTEDNDFKLTTHCSYISGDAADHASASQSIIKEYFVYKSLQAAGYPTSAVRLVNINYLDPQGVPVVNGMGFFLEPEKDLADRCGDAEAKALPTNDEGGQADWYAKMNKDIVIPLLFAEELNQSWDWVFSSGHNTIPIMLQGKIIAISPYDFNDAALVNSTGNIHAFDQYEKVALLSSKDWLSRILQGPFDPQLNALSLSPEERFVWPFKVRAEAIRLLGRRTEVMNALNSSGITDKSAFTAHYNEFFSTLAHYIDTGKVE